jgi:hypothetical protein
MDHMCHSGGEGRLERVVMDYRLQDTLAGRCSYWGNGKDFKKNPQILKNEYRILKKKVKVVAQSHVPQA